MSVPLEIEGFDLGCISPKKSHASTSTKYPGQGMDKVSDELVQHHIFLPQEGKNGNNTSKPAQPIHNTGQLSTSTVSETHQIKIDPVAEALCKPHIFTF